MLILSSEKSYQIEEYWKIISEVASVLQGFAYCNWALTATLRSLGRCSLFGVSL
jgi:hypothetical protein